MGKVQKSFRLDEDLAGAVAALKLEGESEAAALNRIIAAGVTSLEGGAQEDGPAADHGSGDAAALISSLQAHIDTLRAANDGLTGQIKEKDEQIERLHVLIGREQEISTRLLEPPGGGAGEEPAAVDVAEHAPKSDEPQEDESQEPEEAPRKRGLFSRLFG